MRTSLSLALGIVLLSGALTINSFAHSLGGSRDRCFVGNIDGKARFQAHDHHELHHHKPARPFSERIGAFQYRVQPNGNCQISGVQHSSRRHDVGYHKQYNTSNLTREQKLTAQRAVFGDGSAGRYENNVISNRNVIRNNNYVYENAIYNLRRNAVVQESTANFAIELPFGFGRDTQGVYRSKNSSLAFRVIDGGECNSLSFSSCARTANQNFQSANELSRAYNQQEFTRWNQTVHTDFDYFQTVTSSFDALSGINENAYFTFNAIHPITGELVRIEGVAKGNEKDRAAQIMFQLFETFRFAI